MRPINLIPPEDRRGGQAPLRTGPLAYILVGALVIALGGVTALVLANNQISERKSEVAQLQREDAEAKARAEQLAAYTQFQILSEQRVATVSSLADSRFDWERVMRELSLVLPDDVWLVGLSASATPGVSVGGGSGGSSLRGATPGPALGLSGCAAGQEAVAGFVTALKDIDGVTRVGIQSSQLADQDSGAGVGGQDGGGGEDCRTRKFITKFEIVVAFDAAPIPVTGSGEAEEAPATPAEETEADSAETESAEAG
jgi:Tfp pilus assembly protein PilN